MEKVGSQMIFSDALIQLKLGAKVARDCWTVGDNPGAALAIEFTGDRPYFIITYEDNKKEKWKIAHNELFADDWKVVC